MSSISTSPRGSTSSPRASTTSPVTSPRIALPTPLITAPIVSGNGNSTTSTSSMNSMSSSVKAPPKTYEISDTPAVKSGFVWKTTGKKHTDGPWAKRYLELAPRFLLYSKNQKSPTLGVIPLSRVREVQIDTSKKKSNSFGLILDDRGYFFYTATISERNDWVEGIKYNISILKKENNNSLGKPELEIDYSEGEEETELEFKRDFRGNYDVVEPPLGKGTFSTVYKAKNKATGEAVAAKIISKATTQKYQHFLQREIEIMKDLNHPNIVKLDEVYEDENELVLIFELVQGQELFKRVVARRRYSEAETRNVVFQLVLVMDYCHKKRVAHRDLKLENILTYFDGGKEIVKVIDFGLSKKFTEGGSDMLKSRVGSPTYCAPEIYELQPGENYTTAVDIWSIGVITYTLLSGFPPFGNGCDPGIVQNVTRVAYDYTDPVWNNVSQDAKTFMDHIFVLDPRQRYTAADCLNDPWLRNLRIKT
eukprot:TRINITY_DN1673_c0_g2_i2.p1 TRINITY_DN1673_c0_g2~~TRINITY_DN1673_c0_g2_i2.p1  ORF type:complete len:478 (+),score=133.20 TRINITY_DN1673_c0_g2_i2:50-1483(+)